MAKKVLFYNAKGGQGKTTLAVNYTIFSHSAFYTNEYKVGTEDLYKDKITQGKHPERFNVITKDDQKLAIADKSVFDFGGSLDGRIPAVARASDLCVIPIHYQSKAELRPLFIMLSAIAEFNKNILIVINNTESVFTDSLLEGLASETKYPIKVVRHSSFMTYLANDGLTPFELDIKGAPKKALTNIQNQLSDLFNFIQKY
ncbi:hypothetical protein C4J81_19090 (plasmid) [Deltaproteobacteria bacterium Smac51]|nr:hypothetical protein C4J81_19090 [Deltaproteobacteria bacterium Smac51]